MQKIIIVGNGVSGITIIQELFKEMKDYSLDLFTNEPYTHYNRPKLPSFIEHKDMKNEDLIGPYDETWFEKRNCKLHLNENVLNINKDAKKIVTEKGEYSYDKLVLATGAKCVKPKIKGVELKNYYSLRSLDDAQEIKNKLNESKSATVIGGGILGLEVANSIGKRGIETHVIERNAYLLHKQLDLDGSKILQDLLEARNIHFHLNEHVIELVGENEHINYVLCKDNKKITTDIVISCIGIDPEIKLAKEAKLETKKGVIVNNYMETTDENIFAVGDCAEHQGKIYGLWFPCVEQAKVVAANIICPKKAIYEGSKISTTLKVAELFVTSLGYHSDMPKYDDWKTKTYLNMKKREYVKLYLNKEGNIQSTLMIGVKKGLPFLKELTMDAKSYEENKQKLQEMFPELL